jgi:hypothetical protein
MRDARICLAPFLLQWYSLPLSTGETNAQRKVLEVLRATWKREGIEFPNRFDLVMLHTADLSEHTMCTRHTGLLFQRKKGFTYVEKAGHHGPFVRLDLAEMSDLMPWLGVPLAGCSSPNCHHFATFNDRTIERISRK